MTHVLIIAFMRFNTCETLTFVILDLKLAWLLLAGLIFGDFRDCMSTLLCCEILIDEFWEIIRIIFHMPESFNLLSLRCLMLLKLRSLRFACMCFVRWNRTSECCLRLCIGPNMSEHGISFAEIFQSGGVTSFTWLRMSRTSRLHLWLDDALWDRRFVVMSWGRVLRTPTLTANDWVRVPQVRFLQFELLLQTEMTRCVRKLFQNDACMNLEWFSALKASQMNGNMRCDVFRAESLLNLFEKSFETSELNLQSGSAG